MVEERYRGGHDGRQRLGPERLPAGRGRERGNVVDAADGNALSAADGSTAGRAHWNSGADLNGDGVVDIKDTNIMASNFRKTGAP